MVGLAFTHTTVGHGPHEFLITSPAFAPESGLPPDKDFRPPVIDCLSPVEMLYPMSPARIAFGPVAPSARVFGVLAIANAYGEAGWSSYQRTDGSGIAKKRRLRYVPFATGLNADGTRSGAAAALVAHFGKPYTGALYGYLAVQGQALVTEPRWTSTLAAMVRTMESRALIAEAGTEKFTTDVRDLPPGGFLAGFRTLPLNLGAERDVAMRVCLADAQGREIWKQTVKLASVGETAWSRRQPVTQALRKGGAFCAELLVDGRVVDRITQEIGFDGPRGSQSFVDAQKGRFVRGGQPWEAFGVNYLPSSGLSSVVGEEFEFWLDDEAYDPDIVELDLRRIRSLGMNMVSVFSYDRSAEDGNLLDLLRRARRLGLLVNLSLRPNPAPFPATSSTLTTLIRTYRLWEKDEVMAYDIAWEPWWGEQSRRKAQGDRWVRWVGARLGGRDAAEKAWGWELGQIPLELFPTDEMLRVDGPWRRAVLDYRAFVDETLSDEYCAARSLIRGVDPNHLMSFRQSEGANPFVDPGMFPIPLGAVSGCVDFYSPEGYGIGDGAEKSRTMAFAASYAQGLSPGKPLFWAEYGTSVWSGDPFRADPALLAKQAGVFRNILSNARRSRAAGTSAWWFAGGYRAGENSDYGIVNPDNSPRPVEAVIREYAPHAGGTRMPALPRWGGTLYSDPGATVRGYVGEFEQVRESFFDALTSNSIPLVRRRK
jgi:hypothetical protein